MKGQETFSPAASRWSIAGFAAYALIGGGVTMVGWLADLPRLTDWLNSGISMFPNAALAAMGSGVALLLIMIHINERTRQTAENPVERVFRTGKVIGAAKIARDITLQKETDEKLRSAQRKLLTHAANLEATVAERTAELQETVNELRGFSYRKMHE